MRTFVARLKPGDDLRDQIELLVGASGVQAGVVLACVAGLDRVSLRLAGARDFLELDGEFEVVSATGTVSVNGSHIHVSVSDETGRTAGGHLRSGCVVRTTAEVVIGEVDGVFRRVEDPATGFEELDVE